MSKYNNIILAVIAITLCVTLVFSENLIPAYAALITVYDSTGNATGSITRFGNKVFIGDTTANAVYVRSVDDLTTTDATIASVTLPLWMHSDTSLGRVYAVGTTLYEIDPVNNAVLRTLATGCSSMWFSHEEDFMYCSTSTETVNKISLASMSISVTYSTLNAGACAIDTISDLWYDVSSDTLFASSVAGAVQRLVSVENPAGSGTPDFCVAESNIRELAFSNIHNNIMTCSSSSVVSVKLRPYTVGVGFGSATQIRPTGTSNICTVSPVGGLDYHEQSDRYFLLDSAIDTAFVYDALNGQQLFGSVVGSGGWTGGQFYIHSNSISYLAFDGILTTEDFAEFDLTGISLGSAGSAEDDGGAGGIDCSLPENQQILICRLGDNPDCNGTVLGCAGNFIIGNTTGDTGLTPIICATGIVDCVANPDMKTNGVGYLLVTIALAIIIGILWVASRGDLNSIPTFIWFVATLAVVGAFTLMDLIDATFLVITAIIVIALAAAKVRGLFGGEFR